MGKDKWGRSIHDAVASRDAAKLRRMSAIAHREETSMWLTLLARMLELDAARRRRHGARLGRVAVLPSTRRIATVRRAS